MSEPYSVVALFEDLSEPGDEYSYGELRSRIQELLRRHSRAFPPCYTVNEAVEWGLRNGCLLVRGGQVVVASPSGERPASVA